MIAKPGTIREALRAAMERYNQLLWDKASKRDLDDQKKIVDTLKGLLDG